MDANVLHSLYITLFISNKYSFPKILIWFDLFYFVVFDVDSNYHSVVTIEKWRLFGVPWVLILWLWSVKSCNVLWHCQMANDKWQVTNGKWSSTCTTNNTTKDKIDLSEGFGSVLPTKNLVINHSKKWPRFGIKNYCEPIPILLIEGQPSYSLVQSGGILYFKYGSHHMLCIYCNQCLMDMCDCCIYMNGLHTTIFV